VRLHAAADRLYSVTRQTDAFYRDVVKRLLNPCLEQLAPENRERLEREGAALTLDEAVAYALESVGSPASAQFPTSV
jgi:hypothetical protein